MTESSYCAGGFYKYFLFYMSNNFHLPLQFTIYYQMFMNIIVETFSITPNNRSRLPLASYLSLVEDHSKLKRVGCA